MNNSNDNMTLVDFAMHQYLQNDVCPKKASILLRTHYINGWDEKEREVADLIFSLLSSRTLLELIETVDSGFTKTAEMSEVS